MAGKNEIVLISTGWGPGCLSHAGAALLADVYRVETFGLDVETRGLVSHLNNLSRHAPEHAVWQNDELLAVVARALRLAQSEMVGIGHASRGNCVNIVAGCANCCQTARLDGAIRPWLGPRRITCHLFAITITAHC